MKTIKLILVATLFVFATSCKKNDTKPANQNSGTNNVTPTPTPTSVVGSWTFTALDYSNDGITYQSAGPITTTDVLTFNSNGTYSCPTRDFTRMGAPGSNVADNGTYASVGDSIKIVSAVSSNTLMVKATKLTSTELWLRYGCKCYEAKFSKN